MQIKKKHLIYSAKEGVLWTNRKGESVLLSSQKGINQKLLKQSRLILTSCDDCRYLIIEITTKFEEFLDKEKIEHHLKEQFPEAFLGNYNFRWEVLSTHDSNTGSQQKVLLIFPPKNLPSKLAFQDLWVPSEMFTVGIGEKLSQNGELNFIIAALHNQNFVLSIFSAGLLVHFIREPFYDREAFIERLQSLKKYLKNDPALKDISLWKVFYFQSQLDFLHSPPIKAKKLGKSIKGENHLLTGLLNFTSSNYVESLNLLDEDEIDVPVKKRALYHISLISLVTMALMFSVLAGYLIIQSQVKERYQALDLTANQFKKQLDEHNALEKKIKVKEDNISALNYLWQQPVLWDVFLNQLSYALPKNSKILHLSVRRESETSYNAFFKAEVNKWDHVKAFQISLEKLKRVQAVEISNQRQSDKGVVTFDVKVVLQ